MGEVSSVTMKGILIAGIIAALAVEAVESLSCVQCNSLTNSCDNNTASACPSNTSNSCSSSLVNSTLGGAINLYKDKSCSEEVCSEEEKVVASFTVYASEKDHFRFASQCCTPEQCNSKDVPAPPLEDISRTMVCPACYGSQEASCIVTDQKCNTEDKCVSLVAKFRNGTTEKTLVLKGCASISESTCVYLSAQNRVVGGVVFQNFQCLNSSHISSPKPTSTTSTTPTTNTSNTSKVAFIPLALASLLLLGLLL
ncbi:ly6/PLAUR domain-containing protein 8 [Tamandua tetradactyla]|uniref:ly6/PLAUR domain-containing protein 8 n=1 Tax=Tamandua tetradactyla TaxID=48850 RepID=UPI0040549B9E